MTEAALEHTHHGLVQTGGVAGHHQSRALWRHHGVVIITHLPRRDRRNGVASAGNGPMSPIISLKIRPGELD